MVDTSFDLKCAVQLQHNIMIYYYVAIQYAVAQQHVLPILGLLQLCVVIQQFYCYFATDFCEFQRYFCFVLIFDFSTNCL